MILSAGPALAQADPDNPGDAVGLEAAGHDLTGSWVLNEKLSDDFAPPVDRSAARGGGMRGGGMGGGRGGGMGGGMRGGGGPSGGSDPSEKDMDKRRAEMREKMEEMKKKVARLNIFHEGLEFNVTDGLDITHLLYTDGRENTIWTDRGQVSAFAQWDGPTLVTRWRTKKDQPEHVRRFTLDPETDRLTVTESFSQPGSGQSINRTMVYEREHPKTPGM